MTLTGGGGSIADGCDWELDQSLSVKLSTTISGTNGRFRKKKSLRRHISGTAKENV